jgi:hypothetical protein
MHDPVAGLEVHKNLLGLNEKGNEKRLPGRMDRRLDLSKFQVMPSLYHRSGPIYPARREGTLMKAAIGPAASLLRGALAQGGAAVTPCKRE